MKTLYKILALLSLIVIVVVIFFDPIVKYALTTTINKTTDYEIKIDALSTSWRNGTIKFDNIIVFKENKTTKIKQIICNLENSSILKKQLYINLIDIKDISFLQEAIAIKTKKNMQFLDFTQDINNLSTNTINKYINEYIADIQKALEKIKPYLENSDTDNTATTSNSPSISIKVAHIKANGKIENKNIAISNKLNLNDNIIDFKVEINSQNINNIKSTNSFVFTKTNIKLDASNKNEKILAEILDEVKTFYINSRVDFTLDNSKEIDIHLNSNLDKILKDKLKEKFKKKVEDKLEDKAKNLLNKFLLKL